MSTIIATPQPATATIALTVTATTPVTRVLRSDTMGTRPVRAQTGTWPITGTTVLIDHEPAVTGPVSYTVDDGGAGASTTTTLGLTEAWLTVPVTPARSRRLDLVTGLDSVQESANVIHEVIDRIDALVTLGPLRLRAGRMTLWTATAGEARAVAALYGLGEVVHLRQPIPSLDMYHVADSVRVAPQRQETRPRRWQVEVLYREVDWPRGDGRGTLGYSYDDVLADHTSYAALALTVPDYVALALGPTP